MFRLQKPKGTTDVSVPIYVIDSSDGTPETGYTHATTGIDLWYRREGGSETSITEAALAAWNSAHTDGGVEHGSDGRGRLDLPDAACQVGTDGATYVEYGGTITGMIVMGGIVELVDPINEVFQSEVIGSTGNSTTAVHVPNWTYGDDEINDYIIAIKDVSEDEWHFRLVTDWVNSTNLVTVATLPFTPANASDLVCLLGYLGDGSSLTEAGGTGDQLTALATASALATVDSNVDAILVDTGTTIPNQITGLNDLADVDIMPAQNATFTYQFELRDSSGDPATSITVTAQRIIDGAAIATAGGTVTEEGGGVYSFAAAAADMNGAVCTHIFSGTGAKTAFRHWITTGGV